MSFLQLSNGFLNERVDYIMRDWKKKLFCENAKNIIICRQKFHRFKRFLEFHADMGRITFDSYALN